MRLLANHTTLQSRLRANRQLGLALVRLNRSICNWLGSIQLPEVGIEQEVGDGARAARLALKGYQKKACPTGQAQIGLREKWVALSPRLGIDIANRTSQPFLALVGCPDRRGD